ENSRDCGMVRSSFCIATRSAIESCAAVALLPNSPTSWPGETGIMLTPTFVTSSQPLVCALPMARSSLVKWSCIPHAQASIISPAVPRPADLHIDGRLDLVVNLRRELREETGIELNELQTEAGWTLVHDRGIFALVKRLAAVESADQLRSRILRHLASERRPELNDIHIISGPADVGHRILPFVVAYLQDVWRDGKVREEARTAHLRPTSNA